MPKLVVIPRNRPLPAPKRGIEYIYAPATEAREARGRRETAYGKRSTCGAVAGPKGAKYVTPIGLVRHSRDGVVRAYSASNPCPMLRAVNAMWDKRTKRFRLRRQQRFALGVGVPSESRSKRLLNDEAWLAQLARGRKLLRYRKRG